MDDAANEQPETRHDGERPSPQHSGDFAGRRTEQQRLHRRILLLADGDDGSDHSVVVLIQHRSPPPQQVPPQHLRLPVPDLPHHAPHDRLRRLQLRLDQLLRNRPAPTHPLQTAVLQDPRTLRHFLLLRRLRQHVAALPPGVVQPSDRRNDAVLHRRLRLHHHVQEGDRGGLPRSPTCRFRNRRSQQQRASLSPIRLLNLRGVHSWTRFEVRSSRDSVNLRSRKATFDEPSLIYGPNGRANSVTVHALH